VAMARDCVHILASVIWVFSFLDAFPRDETEDGHFSECVIEVLPANSFNLVIIISDKPPYLQRREFTILQCPKKIFAEHYIGAICHQILTLPNLPYKEIDTRLYIFYIRIVPTFPTHPTKKLYTKTSFVFSRIQRH